MLDCAHGGYVSQQWCFVLFLNFESVLLTCLRHKHSHSNAEIFFYSKELKIKVMGPVRLLPTWTQWEESAETRSEAPADGLLSRAAESSSAAAPWLAGCFHLGRLFALSISSLLFSPYPDDPKHIYSRVLHIWGQSSAAHNWIPGWRNAYLLEPLLHLVRHL